MHVPPFIKEDVESRSLPRLGLADGWPLRVFDRLSTYLLTIDWYFEILHGNTIGKQALGFWCYCLASSR